MMILQVRWWQCIRLVVSITPDGTKWQKPFLSKGKVGYKVGDSQDSELGTRLKIIAITTEIGMQKDFTEEALIGPC